MFPFSLVLAIALSQTPAPRMFAIDPGQSNLKFFVTQKMHDTAAESKAPEGKLVLKPDGTVQLMVRAAVASFKSVAANPRLKA